MKENKIKFALRMYPSTQKLVVRHFQDDNCSSQAEFIEKAIRFYVGYINTNNAADFLTESLLKTLQSIISGSETTLRRMMFKLSTELGVLTRIIASYEGLDESSLSRLRGNVVEDLKRTNGTLQLGDAIREHWKSRYQPYGDA